jgi:hypothetical protein
VFADQGLPFGDPARTERRVVSRLHRRREAAAFRVCRAGRE